jgi:tetratricopeptide (TPR) repeat protein
VDCTIGVLLIFFMEIYYSVDERYLHALNELDYDLPAALQLFNQIVTDEPGYARAHYQLGKLYFYQLSDYQAAGYHFKLSLEADPSFPDTYYHYFKLAILLKKYNLAMKLKDAALQTAGVCASCIYALSGKMAEQQGNWNKALADYSLSLSAAIDKDDLENSTEALERVKLKQEKLKRYQYHLT